MRHFGAVRTERNEVRRRTHVAEDAAEVALRQADHGNMAEVVVGGAFFGLLADVAERGEARRQEVLHFFEDGRHCGGMRSGGGW